MLSPKPPTRWTRWLPLLYLAFGLAWILASDAVLGWLLRDSPRLLLVAGTAKGFAFVALTALVLGFWWRVEQRYHAAQLAGAEAREGYATERLAWMSRFANDVILLIDDSGYILECNERAEAAYGYTRQELLSMPAGRLRAPADRPAAAAQYAQVMEHGSLIFEARHCRKDGTEFPVEVSSRRVEFQGKRYIQTIVRDQTELVAANARLEQTVALRTQELTEARDRAEQADRAKTAFLSTISHELRTPLNSIIGFTDIVLQGMSGPLSEDQSKQLAIVHDSAKVLLDLINEMLDLSRIEAGKLQLSLEPVGLRDLLERQVQALKPQSDSKGLALECRIDPGIDVIQSDSRRVAQIVTNLLSNAIKFTAAGGVTLTAATRGATVGIEVRDTGPGIPPDDMANLFKPFMQGGDTQRRHREGTGLGLVISRYLARALGGEIEVTSEAGKGSTFLVTLPVDGPPGAATRDTGFYRKLSPAS